ncbi:cell number regulator 6-like isoform X1 [Magnolia sinica]|uniref:cell number regulator 6-like isoform X1 n=1 Tax=Magnolia sinica TaxID=86752 RepID=UPI0026584CC4|nr:cell number regulator 6-like isoform X1 [Magnolia sinica]
MMAEETTTSRYVKLTKDHDAPMEEIRPGELNQPVQVPQLEVHRCHECGQPLPESYEPPADEPWSTGIFGCAEDTDSSKQFIVSYVRYLFLILLPISTMIWMYNVDVKLLSWCFVPTGWTGLFCPCVLFGRNVENLREDIEWTKPCICHAIFVEGGLALAAATALMVHGIEPRTTFLIGEGLVFAWWMCGIYTGLFRQSLQKKYHLKNSPCDPCMVHCCMHWCAICQEHREMKGRLSDNVMMPMTMVNPPPVQEMNTSESRESMASENGVQHTNLEMRPL